MNVGLSPNKCLIRRSCYYPHHSYYYEGTDWRELTGENRGDLGLTGLSGGEFSSQADSEERASLGKRWWGQCWKRCVLQMV